MKRGFVLVCFVLVLSLSFLSAGLFGDIWNKITGKVVDVELQRGDITKDGKIDMDDLNFLKAYIFEGGVAPEPIELGDLNGDGQIDISDLVALVELVNKEVEINETSEENITNLTEVNNSTNTTEIIGGSCYDSDGGKNVYEKGYVEGNASWSGLEIIGNYSDYCHNSRQLNEMICGNDGLVYQNERINCSNGCFEGACYNESILNESKEGLVEKNESLEKIVLFEVEKELVEDLSEENDYSTLIENVVNFFRDFFGLEKIIGGDDFKEGQEVELTGTFRVMPPHENLIKKVEDGKYVLPKFFTDGSLKKGLQIPKKIVNEYALSQGEGASSFNTLAILVDFNDNPSQVSDDFFDNLMFGEDIGTVRNYYSENSYGNLDLITLNIPSSLGWRRVPQDYSYYVDGQYGYGAYPQNSQRLFEDLVEMVDPLIDFSKYDNDGDGKVDGVIVFHAGSGAELTGNPNDIWSHKWEINPKLKDGVSISKYSMQPEYWISPGDMTLGVVAHETAHLFGLPDLYDFDGSSFGIGKWGLMAYGSWNGPLERGGSPSHFGAWSKMKLGFVNPQVITSAQQVSLYPSEISENGIYRLATSELDSMEYFLVENRQKIGYDEFLPGEGVLIWHIDENKINNDGEWYPGLDSEDHYKVALEQADNYWDLEKGMSVGDVGDFYPGSMGNIFFDSDSTPNSRRYDGQDSQVFFKYLSKSDNVIDAFLSGDNCNDFDGDNDGYSVCDLDCNDNDPNINPSAIEICGDKIDNNCNSFVDENIRTFYYDSDGDGYGTSFSTVVACFPPPDYAYLSGDCNDKNPNINPSVIEVCGNGVDDNCNELIDDNEDYDSDGYFVCGESIDCNDNNPLVYPGAERVCTSSGDFDCNGIADNQEGSCQCGFIGGQCLTQYKTNPCPSDNLKVDYVFNENYFCPYVKNCCVIEAQQVFD